jgi:hypothetical protein
LATVGAPNSRVVSSTNTSGTHFNRNSCTWSHGKVAALKHSTATTTGSNVSSTATATTNDQNIKRGYTIWYDPVARTGLFKFFDRVVTGFVLVSVTTIVKCKRNQV